MGKKLIVQLSDDYELVAEKYKSNMGFPNEICVYIRNQSKEIMQDICCVNASYKCTNNGINVDESQIECEVWLDDTTENCSHHFKIRRQDK